MTDRCDSATRRPRDYTSNETSCEPTREESAASRAAAQQETEREAEVRRNAYFASGADEGGRSKNASSDAGALQTSTPDDKNLRVINNATKYDPPIQSDPLGNALIGIAGGGIVGGIEAGVGKVGLAGARGMFLQPMSRELVKGTVVGEATGGVALVRGAAIGAARTGAKSARNAAVVEGGKAAANALVDTKTPAVPVSDAQSATPATTSVAGQSSKNGASVPVSEPNRSEGPRIPEAWNPPPVRIQG
jgi:hypothetical protein